MAALQLQLQAEQKTDKTEAGANATSGAAAWAGGFKTVVPQTALDSPEAVGAAASAFAAAAFAAAASIAVALANSSSASFAAAASIAVALADSSCASFAAAASIAIDLAPPPLLLLQPEEPLRHLYLLRPIPLLRLLRGLATTAALLVQTLQPSVQVLLLHMLLDGQHLSCCLKMRCRLTVHRWLLNRSAHPALMWLGQLHQQLHWQLLLLLQPRSPLPLPQLVNHQPFAYQALLQKVAVGSMHLTEQP